MIKKILPALMALGLVQGATIFVPNPQNPQQYSSYHLHQNDNGSFRVQEIYPNPSPVILRGTPIGNGDYRLYPVPQMQPQAQVDINEFDSPWAEESEGDADE